MSLLTARLSEAVVPPRIRSRCRGGDPAARGRAAARRRGGRLARPSRRYRPQTPPARAVPLRTRGNGRHRRPEGSATPYGQHVSRIHESAITANPNICDSWSGHRADAGPRHSCSRGGSTAGPPRCGKCWYGHAPADDHVGRGGREACSDAREADRRAVNLLAAYDAHTGIVLGPPGRALTLP